MPTSDARDAATWGMLFGLLVLAGGLLGLMAMVAPHVFGIALIVVGFLGGGALHYLIWGWWLRQTLTENDDAEAQDADNHRV